ncbi:glycosyltransferase family 4 protein [soil metagenome]
MRRTVLHLIDTGGPGGAETVFLELATRLNSERWRSVAVVPSRDWLHGALRERGVEPVVLRSRRAFDAGYLAALHRLGAREGAALIQTHLLTTWVYGSAVARLRRLPLVGTLHGAVDLPEGDRHRALKLRLTRRDASRVVFVSESLRRTLLQREPIAAARTLVIRNGIDLDHWTPGADDAFRSALGLRPGELLVTAVGNVRQSKDYENLLRAAAWLRDRGTTCRIAVAGDTRGGGLYEGLLVLRRELGLDDTVSFLGFEADVRRVLWNSDVYVLASSQEGFSLTTVQALACGVPVVATRSGGPEEIVSDGAEGLLVPVRDPAALGAAVRKLLLDAPLRARMAEAGRRRAEAFGVDRMVAAYERLYDELTGSPDRGGEGAGSSAPVAAEWQA